VIERVWLGWTRAENADTYEELLKDQIFPGIAAKNIEGCRGMRVLRRGLPGGDVEFMTIITFDSLDAVRAFVGDDYEVAYVPPSARELLDRFDDRARHYELREQLAC
jgi:hypothetical protein